MAAKLEEQIKCLDLGFAGGFNIYISALQQCPTGFSEITCGAQKETLSWLGISVK